VVISGRGSVTLVPFPFSDLSQAKLRPAVVLADAGRLKAEAFARVRAGVLRVLD
jgi:hypothetical protein